MKPIKINKVNAEKIESALKDVNGRAYKHAYTDLEEVEAIVARAEKMLADLKLMKKHHVGAQIESVSGADMCNAYAKKCYTRPATRVRIVRRASGWFLADVQKVTVWQSGGGADVLSLTTSQKNEAISALFEDINVV